MADLVRPHRLARRSRAGWIRLSLVTIGTDAVIVAFLVRGLLFRANRTDAHGLLDLWSLPGSAAHPHDAAKTAGGTSGRFTPRC